MKRLIVNADDFGLCPGTVRGILYGMRYGIITSTSLIFTTPAAPLAVEAAVRHPEIDVGVHLTFTEGRPLLPPQWVPSLMNEEGKFPSAREWLASGRYPQIGELRAEFRAQIQSALVAGLRISHLDLHTTAGYILPDVFELTVKLAADHGLAIRYPFGEGWEKMAMAAAKAAAVPIAQMETLVAHYRQVVARSNIRHPDRFWDPFAAGDTDPAALARFLAALPDGTTELLTHPARVAGCRRYLGAEADRRAAELAAWCDPRVRQAVMDAGIELVNFRQL